MPKKFVSKKFVPKKFEPEKFEPKKFGPQKFEPKKLERKSDGEVGFALTFEVRLKGGGVSKGFKIYRRWGGCRRFIATLWRAYKGLTVGGGRDGI